MKIIRKLWNAAGLPCRTCGGKGYVVNSDVDAFIERNGLAAFEAAETLMVNEIEYGALGSIPVGTWEEVGLPEDQAELYVTEIGCSRILHSCPSCHGQKNHDDALGLATSIIRSLKANDRRRYAEWKAKQTPVDRKERLRRQMVVAVQHAQLRREMDTGDFSARERDAGTFGDMVLPMGEL